MNRLPEPIAVLGGSGFLGANLVKRLVADGYEVTAISRVFPEFRTPLLKGAELWIGDMRDPRTALVGIGGFGTVFHLAADMGGVGYMHSEADGPASTDNGRMTANILDACKKWEVPRLFFASSACSYPIEYQHGNPAPKLHEYQLRVKGTPDALYGVEKLHGMEMVEKAGGRVGVLHTIYGPYQEHEGIRMKFPPAVATKAIAARQSRRLEMWGSGSQLRSYQYVDDAIEKIMRITASDTYYGPVNVGYSGAISCLDAAELCLKIAGAENSRIIVNPDQPTGVHSRDCDNLKFNRLYGRMDEIGYEEGFKRLIEWLDSL